MTYDSGSALRQALDQRLVNSATQLDQPVDRLRKRVVFERILVRLEADKDRDWVLKGGMALELRWSDRARTTRDLDLAAAELGDARKCRLSLARALAVDPDGDRFTFEVSEARPISAEEVGGAGWRLSVTATLAGRTFAQVRVDIVDRPEETLDTARVALPGMLAFAGAEPHACTAASLARHWAEKLHAMTRSYDDRPSTRVRDLVDMVMIIEADGADRDEVRAIAKRVFAARGTHGLPDRIADPPDDWATTYAAMADELDLTAATLEEAMAIVRKFWETDDGGGGGRHAGS